MTISAALTTTATSAALAIPESARELAESSISASTRRAYAGALARLDSFTAGRPLDDATLAVYLAELHDAGKSPATIGLAVAAVRFRAKLTGAPSPAGPATDRVLAGARRQGAGRGRGQVAGVTWGQADAAAAVAANGGGHVAGLRDAAIVAVMSDAMLRVSEVAALDCADVERDADGSGRVTVRRSKSDQEARGAVLYIGPATVARLDAWLSAAGHQSGAMFRSVRRGGHVTAERISARALRTIIAKRAADAGISGRVSGHSLRIGSAQSLAAAGASVVDMQTAGRWKDSAMPAHYARGALAGRGAVARLRYGASA